MESEKLEHGGVASHDRGAVMSIYNGNVFYPLDAQPDEIDIDTISRSLSKQCRFNGHTLEFYSVAQHSVLVSSIVPEKDQLCGLLHDATEAYIGDLIRPLKKVLPDFMEIESTLWKAIAIKFALPLEMPDSVKIADNILLATEKRDLLAPQTLVWGPLPEPLTARIIPLTNSEDARISFMERFAELS